MVSTIHRRLSSSKKVLFKTCVLGIAIAVFLRVRIIIMIRRARTPRAADSHAKPARPTCTRALYEQLIS